MRRFVTIFKTLFIAAIAGSMFQACDRTPDYVIGPKEMTSLLVDIHKGESVIDLNRSAYSSDSMRKVVKQSIYAKHGVTAEQVDTSLVWYGHNVEKYIEIYDGVIEQLEKDIKNADVSSGGERLHLAVVGDSVDAWSDVPYRHFFNGERLTTLSSHFRMTRTGRRAMYIPGVSTPTTDCRQSIGRWLSTIPTVRAIT